MRTRTLSTSRGSRCRRRRRATPARPPPPWCTPRTQTTAPPTTPPFWLLGSRQSVFSALVGPCSLVISHQTPKPTAEYARHPFRSPRPSRCASPPSSNSSQPCSTHLRAVSVDGDSGSPHSKNPKSPHHVSGRGSGEVVRRVARGFGQPFL